MAQCDRQKDPEKRQERRTDPHIGTRSPPAVAFFVSSQFGLHHLAPLRRVVAPSSHRELRTSLLSGIEEGVAQPFRFSLSAPFNRSLDLPFFRHGESGRNKDRSGVGRWNSRPAKSGFSFF